MIILEDSVWNKLKKFADDRRNKVLAKRDAKLDSTDYEDSSIGIKTQKLYKALADKSNLSLTKDIWITALLEIRDPLQSELYDFLMNSQSEFVPQVATVIVKLFKSYRQLTAKIAIDSLNLDNPEYTESNDKIAELIKETKDVISKNVFVDPTVYKIYRILYNIKNPSQVKKEVNNMTSTVLEDKIAKTWQKRLGLEDEKIELLKSKSTLFEPGEDVIDLAESSMGEQDEIFLKLWQGKIEEWLEKNGNKNK